MAFKTEKRMSIYSVGESHTKFVRAVRTSGELAVDPGHVIYTTALELYPDEDSSKFSIFNYHIHDYCLAIINGIKFTKDTVYPLINGIENDVQICDNGNVRYRGFEIIKSGKIGSTTECVCCIYNNDKAIIGNSDSLDAALDLIDRAIIVR